MGKNRIKEKFSICIGEDLLCVGKIEDDNVTFEKNERGDLIFNVKVLKEDIKTLVEDSDENFPTLAESRLNGRAFQDALLKRNRLS
jgi:hypothetical protein